MKISNDGKQNFNILKHDANFDLGPDTIGMRYSDTIFKVFSLEYCIS